MTLISVIVIAYNLEKIIGKCLDSILSQTLQDFELIVINDGSNDGTWNVLQQYMSKDKRMRAIDQKNSGPGAAYNTGLRSAVGQYVYILDGDNFIEPTLLEILYTKIVEKNVQVAICEYYIDQYDKAIYKEIGEIRGRDILCGTKQEVAAVFFELYVRNIIQSPCNKLYEKKLIEDMYFDENRKQMMIVDTEFNLRVFEKLERMVCIHHKLVHYVQYTEEEREQITSLWHKAYDFRAFDCQLKLFQYILAYLGKNPEKALAMVYRAFAKTCIGLFQTLILDPDLTDLEKRKEITRRVQQISTLDENIKSNYFPYRAAFFLIERNDLVVLKIVFGVLCQIKIKLPLLFQLLKGK